MISPSILLRQKIRCSNELRFYNWTYYSSLGFLFWFQKRLGIKIIFVCLSTIIIILKKRYINKTKKHIHKACIKQKKAKKEMLMAYIRWKGKRGLLQGRFYKFHTPLREQVFIYFFHKNSKLEGWGECGGYDKQNRK